MKWLKRFCWLSAWCVWLWLGFGLYRELPRELGPVVCKLPLGTGEYSSLGFIADDDLVVFREPLRIGGRRFFVFDARQGILARELEIPTDAANSSFDPCASVRSFGLLVYAVDAKIASERQSSVEVADLRNGCRRSLFRCPSGNSIEDLTLHEVRPWAAFVEVIGERNQRVRVIDYQLGADVFSSQTTSRCLGGSTYFADGDCVLVPSGKDAKALSAHEAVKHDVWRIGATPTKVGVVERPPTWDIIEVLDVEPSPPLQVGYPCYESWNQLWEKWLPNLKLNTWAIMVPVGRELDFRYRLRDYPITWSTAVNSNATLVVLDDYDVYELPPHVNWPLLALCQTILALPLVLLWALLKWRGRRAARRQLSEAAP